MAAIKFSPNIIGISDCRDVISQTGLQSSHRADLRLKSDLNSSLQRLIARLRGIPIPSTGNERNQLHEIRAAINELHRHLGVPGGLPNEAACLRHWSKAIAFFKSASVDVSANAFDARLTTLVKELSWLGEEISKLEWNLQRNSSGVRAPNYTILGPVCVQKFFFDLFPTYQEIFGRLPAASRGLLDGPAGPTYRFIEAVLRTVERELSNQDIIPVAQLKYLRYSRHTAEGWIRKYRSKNNTLAQKPSLPEC
jgi:hypothetical protein